MSDEEVQTTPMIDLILSILTPDPTGEETYILDKPGELRLTKVVAEMEGKPDKDRNIAELVNFAHFMHTERACTKAAKVVLAVCGQDPSVLDGVSAAEGAAATASLGQKRLSTPTAEEQNQLASTSARFKNFEGKFDSLQAPKLGDEAPEGTVKIGNFRPVRC